MRPTQVPLPGDAASLRDGDGERHQPAGLGSGRLCTDAQELPTTRLRLRARLMRARAVEGRSPSVSGAKSGSEWFQHIKRKATESQGRALSSRVTGVASSPEVAAVPFSWIRPLRSLPFMPRCRRRWRICRGRSLEALPPGRGWG